MEVLWFSCGYFPAPPRYFADPSHLLGFVLCMLVGLLFLLLCLVLIRTLSVLFVSGLAAHLGVFFGCFSVLVVTCWGECVSLLGSMGEEQIVAERYDAEEEGSDASYVPETSQSISETHKTEDTPTSSKNATEGRVLEGNKKKTFTSLF